MIKKFLLFVALAWLLLGVSCIFTVSYPATSQTSEIISRGFPLQFYAVSANDSQISIALMLIDFIFYISIIFIIYFLWKNLR